MASLYNKDKDFNKDKDYNKDKTHLTHQHQLPIATTTTTTTSGFPQHQHTQQSGDANLLHGQHQHQQHQHGLTTGEHVHMLKDRLSQAVHGTATTATTATSAEQKLVLAEEKLVVNKSVQDAGGIEIEKRVDRTTAHVPITLEREVVSVERRPITGATAASLSDIGFGKEKEIVATVHADQAIATKKIEATEQVRVDKHRVAENKVEQAQVRSENVEVKRDVRDVDAIRWTGAAEAARVQHGNIIGPDGRVVAFEEKLAVGKERVEAGHVALQKRVETSTASAPVRLESDEVHVTREPVSAGSVSAPTALTEGSAHIGLKKEVAHVEKVVVPKEEVVLKKGVQVEQHTVQAELARERIHVKAQGGIEQREGCSACADKDKQHQQHVHDDKLLQRGSGFTSGFTQPNTTQPGFSTGYQSGKLADQSSGFKHGTTTTTTGSTQPALSTGQVRLHN